jgi:dsRNA-specific ribonuclease
MNNLRQLEHRLAYYFDTRFYLYSALHYRSPNFNQLEWLGDTVLDVVLAYHLVRTGDYDPQQLTLIRMAINSHATQARIGQRLGLTDLLHTNNGHITANQLENAFEALVGAVFLDTQGDFPRICSVILPHLRPYITQEIQKPQYANVRRQLCLPPSG